MHGRIPRINRLEPAQSFCDRLYRDESGQDLIEYALLAALLASASVASTQSLAAAVANEFTSIQTAVDNSTSSNGGSGGGNNGGFGDHGDGGDHH